MKTISLLILVTLVGTSIANARITVTTPSPICLQSQISGVAESLFCTNPDSFSEQEFCQELDCLTSSHPSHCRRSLERITEELQLDLNQDSPVLEELESTFLKFCADPNAR